MSTVLCTLKVTGSELVEEVHRDEQTDLKQYVPYHFMQKEAKTTCLNKTSTRRSRSPFCVAINLNILCKNTLLQ